MKNIKQKGIGTIAIHLYLIMLNKVELDLQEKKMDISIVDWEILQFQLLKKRWLF